MSGPRQHITPSFYLSQFCGSSPEGCVWVYDKQKDEPRPSDPDAVGLERHFYSVRNEDGSWNTTLDDWITGVESKAEPVFRGLLSLELPKDHSQEKYDFALYLAVLHARTKANRQLSAEIYASMIQYKSYVIAREDHFFNSHIRQIEKQRGEALSPELRESVRQGMLDPSRFIMEVAKAPTLLGFSVVDELAPRLFKMNWMLVHPERSFFITSDNPVLRRVPKDSVHPILGDGGWRNKKVEIFVPLSPRLALLLTPQPLMRTRGVIPPHTVEEANSAIASDAARFVYAHLQHKHLQRLVRRFKDTKHAWRMHGGPKKMAEVRVKR